MGRFFLIVGVIFFIISCGDNKKNSDKQIKINKKINKVVTKKRGRILKKRADYIGNSYSYKKLSFILNSNFSKIDENNFFGENGANITIDFDKTEYTIEDYLGETLNIIKKEFPRFVQLESEVIDLNGKKAIDSLFMFDKQKYLIEIRSIVIKDGNDIYLFNLTAKKRDFDKYQNSFQDIVSSIELK